MSERPPVQPFARQAGHDPVAPPLAFGDVFRQLRRVTGLSQEALAERASVSWRTISDIERGIRRKPQQETFRLLADALALSPEDRTLLEAAARSPAKAVVPAALALVTSLPASAPSPAAPSSLPVPMTPLVGRAREIAALCALVRDDAVRLLTVTGPGGVGKTRLAVAVATALTPDFPNGVCFVPLAPVQDASFVLPTIAQALGMEERQPVSPREALFARLQERRLLLVLDNFEHLTAASGAVAELLAACPHLTVLVTSRAALRVYGEQEFPVPTLLLAPADNGGNFDLLATSPAVELFRQRAAAVRPGFALSAANILAVAEICARLDGLPLAIELAVARIKLFSPTELLDRLRGDGHSLALLSGGARDAPARQRTMRDAIAWSYDLLGATEQTLFRRLAVFTGGWTLEAAEAVCGDDGALDVYDGIAALIDQSLVRTREEGVGETRFAMLETIREYAAALLAAHEELPLLKRRHAASFVAIAEAAGPGLSGPDQAHWLGRIDADHENFRAALTWARDMGDDETGLRIAAALGPFWHVRGYLAEGRRWLELFLARAPGDPAGANAVTRAAALEGLAIIATRQGDTPLIDRCATESLAIYRAIGDQRGIASALHNLGRAALVRTDYRRAKGYYAESLALRRQINDRKGIAETLSNLGRLTRFEGDYTQAAALLGEAATLWREERDALGLASALGNLGHMARDRGDRTAATPLIEESLVLYRALKNTRGIGIALNQLALLAYDAGEYAQAGALSEESMALRREIGDAWGIANCHCTLGDIARATGQPAAALAHYRAGIPHYQKVGTMTGVAECVERIAFLASEGGGMTATARLLGAAAALRETASSPVVPVDRPAYDRAVATARDALGAEAFAAAWAAGHALTVDAAIAEALADSA